MIFDESCDRFKPGENPESADHAGAPRLVFPYSSAKINFLSFNLLEWIYRYGFEV
jgi:hypothetical protein